MGTRTYSRRGADGRRVLTPAGQAKFFQVTGLAAQGFDIFGNPIDVPDEVPVEVAPPTTAPEELITFGANAEALSAISATLRAVPLDRTLNYEQMVLLDASGKEIYRKDGEQYGVNLDNVPPNIIQQAALVTHNHPDAYPMSNGDIMSILSMPYKGMEARGHPVTVPQRQAMNEYFNEMKAQFEAQLQGKLKKAEREDIQKLIATADLFLQSPNSTEWSYVMHNDNTAYDFRQGGLRSKRWTKRVEEVQKNTDVISMTRQLALRSGQSKETLNALNIAANILIQHVAVQDALADSSVTYVVRFDN